MIGKNRLIHRFVREHIYELSRPGWLAVAIFKRRIHIDIHSFLKGHDYYQFRLLAKTGSPKGRGILRIINPDDYNIKELRTENLPLYISLYTYPSMEKLLKEYYIK